MSVSIDLPTTEEPSSWKEYHNQDGAEANLRSLRTDHDVRCQCDRCTSDGLDLAANEDALDKGELDGTRDHLKDTTGYQVPVGQRSELRDGKHQTEWRESEVTTTVGIDKYRWESMWLFQIGAMGEAPIEGRSPSDLNGDRETADKINITEIISNRLGCTSHQRKQVISVMKKIDVGLLGAHSDNRKAAIAAASIVTREKRAYSELDTDRVDYDTSITKPVRIEKSDTFENLCDEFDFNPDFLSTVKQSIKGQLDGCDTD